MIEDKLLINELIKLISKLESIYLLTLCKWDLQPYDLPSSVWHGKAGLQQVCIQGEKGWSMGLECKLGLCKSYVGLVVRHLQGISHWPSFKTNNPTVFYLHCKSEKVLELCFSADSREVHSMSHSHSLQQFWGRKVSSLFGDYVVWIHPRVQLKYACFCSWQAVSPGVRPK